MRPDESQENADSVYGDDASLSSATARDAESPPNASGVEENPWGENAGPSATENMTESSNAPDPRSAGGSSAPDPRSAGGSSAPDPRSAGGSAPDTENTSAEDPQDPQEPAGPPVEDFKDRRIKALEVIIEERDQTLRDYIAAHKTEKANMEAFKNRLKRDQEREVEAAAAKKAETLIDVLDNLFLTAQACREGGEVEALVAGVEMVAQQFLTTLESHGVQRVDPVGAAFDPNCMEAMSMVPVTDEAQNNIVLTTVRTGYSLGDRELRPAMVTVGRLIE